MKAMIPWFCLAAITQTTFAQTGIEAYRQGDYVAAAAALQAKTTHDPVEEYYLGRMYLYGYGVLKSTPSAIRSLKLAAEKGFLDAQLMLGRMAVSQDANPQQALYWFKKAAALNDSSAQLYCAGAYLFGVGTTKNEDVARGYYIAAARAGNAVAQQTLAANFLATRAPANRKLGLPWLEKAVAARDPEADVMMADLYLRGDMVSADTDQAIKLTEEAIAQGYSPALFQMARIEQYQSHLEEAQSWYHKAAVAEYIPAQIALAELYLDPKSEIYSVHEGFLWMLKAAKSGSAKAQQVVSEMYQKGQGVVANKDLSLLWEKRSKEALQGSAQKSEQQMAQWLTRGKAMQLSATEYRLGGILSDWQNRLALRDNTYNPAPQMNLLTKDMLFKPAFVMVQPNEIPINQYYDAMVMAQVQLPKEKLVFAQYPIQTHQTQGNDTHAHDPLQAKRDGYDYLTRAAQLSNQSLDYAVLFKQLLSQAVLGDSTAQFDVAQMYQQGIGVEKSIEKSIAFYELAAAQNDLPSEYQLGLYYLQGEEVPADYHVAMDWLLDAAFKGNTYAQYALARIYEQGYSDASGQEVIPPNQEQSLSMYQLAATNNYGPAQYRLAEIMVREQPKDRTLAALEARRRLIKTLYQGAESYGLEDAKLPLAFYHAMDADEIKQAEAFASAQKAADSGSIDAAFLLGLMYDRGIATEKNHQQALHWYEQASSNPVAAFVLGTYAADGNGFVKQADTVTNYLQFAVDKGFAPANYNISVVKYRQNGKFLPYLEKAVALGSSYAGLEMADYYMSVGKDPQHIKEARNLYERFAQQKDKTAQLKLGYMYEQGLGGQQDLTQAVAFYTAAAEQGESRAQYFLGRLYQLGLLDKTPDYVMAKKWYALAQTKYPAAAVAYGYIDEIVHDDYMSAMSSYQQAADLGDPVANYDLGLMYEMGKNQPVDLEKAKTLYLQAADKGVLTAMVPLGELYLNEHKDKEALIWFRKAAALGDATAKYHLGAMLEKGVGTAPSISDAVQYYQQSAEQGNAKALFALANMYQYGQGIAQNKSQAAKYYGELAQQNNAQAQYQLALFCFSGFASDCTKQQGKEWLKKAQENGCKEAAQMLRWDSAKSQPGLSYIESVTLSSSQGLKNEGA